MIEPSLTDLASAKGKVFGTAYRSTYAAGDPCYHDVAYRSSVP